MIDPSADLSGFYQQVVSDLQAPINAFCEAAGNDPDPDNPRIQRLLVNTREAMSRALDNALNAAALIGAGTGDLTDEEKIALADIKASQMDYLQGFIADLAGMNCDQALARAALYATAVIHAISTIAALPLPDLPYMPGDKALECSWHCRCRLVINKLDGEGNWDVFWLMDENVEHCESCKVLSDLWNPLKIRDGVIEGDYLLKAGLLASAKILHALTRNSVLSY